MTRVSSGSAGAGIDMILLGVGAIGRALVHQLSERKSPVRVCGLVDRSGYLFDPAGLSRQRLRQAVALKKRGQPLASTEGGRTASAGDALASIATHALSSPVLVDATAADTAPLLERSLEHGWDLVLANKIPLAGSQASADRLDALARAHGCRILHEATVGAGLPVIDTVRALLRTGDRITRIEGCPSGTLGYLFGELGRGRSFSDAVRSAVASSYTEPDPRIDLSGLDVARKAIILARMIGYRGEPADAAPESLVPQEMADIPLADFLARLGELDARWDHRVRSAAARGEVLRYRARVTPRSLDVGLVTVPASDPLAGLSGTDNQFAFTTARYAAQPLIVRGPGAGSSVTAAAIHNDLLQLADRRSARPSIRASLRRPSRRGTAA